MSERIEHVAGELTIPSGPWAPIEVSQHEDDDDDIAPAGWDAFRAAAKRLKTAETEYRAAQQGYAEAVKHLSEEATK